eukprot:931875_1
MDDKYDRNIFKELKSFKLTSANNFKTHVKLPLMLCQLIAQYCWQGIHLHDDNGLKGVIVNVSDHRSMLSGILNHPNGFCIEFMVSLPCEMKPAPSRMFLLETICDYDVHDLRIGFHTTSCKSCFLHVVVIGYNMSWNITPLINQRKSLNIKLKCKKDIRSMRVQLSIEEQICEEKHLQLCGYWSQFGYHVVECIVGAMALEKHIYHNCCDVLDFKISAEIHGIKGQNTEKWFKTVNKRTANSCCIIC